MLVRGRTAITDHAKTDIANDFNERAMPVPLLAGKDLSERRALSTWLCQFALMQAPPSSTLRHPHQRRSSHTSLQVMKACSIFE
jgi:hypothetical protein